MQPFSRVPITAGGDNGAVTRIRGSYRTGRARAEEILAAAQELFIAEGYGATSLRGIAAAVGISHPALLRYFPTKGDVLTALVRKLDVQASAWLDESGDSDSTVPGPGDIARRSQATPGWVELFTALLGEATSPEHPGHELMLGRRHAGLALVQRLLAPFSPDDDSARVEALRLAALWDGLQILWLYFPGEIDLPGHLDAYAEEIEAHGVPRSRLPTARSADGGAAEGGAARSRRRVVIEAAARRYALSGYYGASMRSVAEEAGVSLAALIHIAPTKEALLHLVVSELFAENLEDSLDWMMSWMSSIGDRPRWLNAAQVVLLCEATVPSHPAHDALRARLAAGREVARASLEGSGVADDVARPVADGLVALALGSIVGWMYDGWEADPAVVLGDTVTRVLRQP